MKNGIKALRISAKKHTRSLIRKERFFAAAAFRSLPSLFVVLVFAIVSLIVFSSYLSAPLLVQFRALLPSALGLVTWFISVTYLSSKYRLDHLAKADKRQALKQRLK